MEEWKCNHSVTRASHPKHPGLEITNIYWLKFSIATNNHASAAIQSIHTQTSHNVGFQISESCDHELFRRFPGHHIQAKCIYLKNVSNLRYRQSKMVYHNPGLASPTPMSAPPNRNFIISHSSLMKCPPLC